MGYGSPSEKTVHFGLGGNRVVNNVEIHWPSGQVQKLKSAVPDRYLKIQEPR